MICEKLKSIILSKLENGENPQKIFEDLQHAVSLPTIERWKAMIRKNGALIRKQNGRPRTVCTAQNFQKVEMAVKVKKSVRKVAAKLRLSKTSVDRILRIDLGLKAYKRTTVPLLTYAQKVKRVKFSHWVRHNYTKQSSQRILFSDEKIFDLDGIYNKQNDRVWAATRKDAD